MKGLEMKKALLVYLAYSLLGIGGCLTMGCRVSGGHDGILWVEIATRFETGHTTKQTTEVEDHVQLEVAGVQDWLEGIGADADNDGAEEPSTK